MHGSTILQVVRSSWDDQIRIIEQLSVLQAYLAIISQNTKHQSGERREEPTKLAKKGKRKNKKHKYKYRNWWKLDQFAEIYLVFLQGNTNVKLNISIS